MAEREETPEQVMHCPQCLESLDPRAHFCTRCGTPLTMYATAGPLEHVWTYGWLINRLLSNPRPSTITLIGTWLISLPMLLVLPPVLMGLLLNPMEQSLLERVLVNGPLLLIEVCFLLLVARVTIAYLRSPHLSESSPEEAP